MLKIKTFKSGYLKNGKGFWIATEMYIEKTKDAFIYQDIIRSKFNDYSVESSFGYSENFEEILELNYLLEPNLNQILIEYSLDSGIIIHHQNK